MGASAEGTEGTLYGGLNLLDLNHDILHLVVRALRFEHPRSLFSLITVSKAFHDLVLPQLYYSVDLLESSFRGHNLKLIPFLTRLEDDDDNLRNMIRELTISDDTTSSFTGDTVDIDMLLRLLGCVVSLHSLSWKTSKVIPEEVVELLGNRWPNVQVFIPREIESGRGYDYFLEKQLLASPVVRSLFLRMHRDIYEEEFQIRDLSQFITEATNVQRLGLDATPCGSRIYPARRLSPCTWNPGTVGQLTNLVSLNLLQHAAPNDYSDVLLSTATRTILAEAPKWTHLNELQLCGLEPSYTIRNLKYRVPNLKHLELSYGNRRPEYNHPPVIDESSDELYLAQSFVSHLSGLQELRITNDVPEIKAICLAILELQELEALSFHTNLCNQMSTQSSPVQIPIFEATHLRQLKTSRIRHLELDVSAEDFFQHCGQSSLEQPPPDSLIQIFAEFTRLRTLTLCVTISGASDFTEEVHEKVPMLWEDKAKNAVEILFRKIYNGRTGNGLLGEVELWFKLIQESSDAKMRWGESRVKATRVYEPCEIGKDVKLKVEVLDRWINEYGELRVFEKDG